MTNRTVLVTGGAGYIGSHAVLALMDAGYRAVVLDNLSTGVRAAVPEGVAFHQGEVGDDNFVRGILAHERPDAVLHFAGSIIVAESVLNPSLYYRNNTGVTLALARTCVEAGVGQFVFSSTAAVYGEADSGPIAEDAPCRPISPYGRSKWMAEQILFDLARAHPTFLPVALRYFNVAGADPQGRAGQRGANVTHLIGTAIDVALGRREELQIFGDDYPTRDGTGERDFIHVSDLAQAHVSALAYLEGGGTSCPINCGYGRGFTVKDVVETVTSVIGRPLPTVVAPRRAGDAASVVADVSRLRALLEWSPRWASLEQMVESALVWERVRRTF
jgi:UDP-glucose 4-epimerase